ncbi:MAG: glutamate-5-semialdehyde dehydrogenase [Candidatus Omnitrophica bacterium CG11_big_fil_rev_8_21_14_0_20_42_13]|uniref:Gamma-glutamyl phosphate reductase n=1 Tax=Candidatus Ghiorseimicrobium undicola TaxID=1974746 RepID=A0A2H0LZB7_9BACT|nr:MAG: glutamate-5-semialdehyde dehydrogenase [Candidatus Omnitrophica bacterium CG11_big_fil_rev_8_21_14_0_20_42_13]
MENKKKNILSLLKKAKESSFEVSFLPGEIKDRALSFMAKALIENKNYIIKKNRLDINIAKKKSLSKSLIDRLLIDEKRIGQMSKSLEELILLKDPVGSLISENLRPNGLKIDKVRVPIGVILIIYESRPNVTSDCIGLALKSGNVSILRGGSEAINSNLAIFTVLKEAAKLGGVKEGAFNLIGDTDRAVVNFLLKSDKYIDLVIPRGGEALIRKVSQLSRIPVIKHYKGICAVYVDSNADLNMAEDICFNAKVQRPSVCNAAETLLVHQDVAGRFLPGMAKRFKKAGVEIRGCPQTYKILKGSVKKANISDWSKEFLGLILAVKVVKDIDEAIEHINYYGSHHSDSIVTDDADMAKKFLGKVDSASVFHNASTRFSDGHEFGLGAEIGISTDKIHARGPMGLEELCSYKYQVYGNGQIRQ